MKRSRIKQILEAAAKLPPAKGRALVAAIAGKEEQKKTPDPREEPLAAAQLLMEASMIEAVLNTLESQP